MYRPITEAEDIIREISEMPIGEEDVLLIMIGEKNRPDIKKIISCLNERKIKFFGGIFPGLIDGENDHDQGVIIERLPIVKEPFLIENFSEADSNLGKFGSEIRKYRSKKYTAMILVDGKSSGIGSFLSSLFHEVGDIINYFGGGAGSSEGEEPCLFLSGKEKMIQHAAIIALIKLESSIGVRHGWKKLGENEKVVATATQENRIIQLNWESAYNVYKKIIKAEELNEKDFKRHPFGIVKEGRENVVRDVRVREDEKLVCVGDIPEHSVLNILKGDSDNLIEAAKQAAEDAVPDNKKNVQHLFVIDCISRKEFLRDREDEFKKELQNVNSSLLSSGQQKPVGILSIGEIASDGETFPDFLNKTIVITSLYESHYQK